jgi:hypothetical protein
VSESGCDGVVGVVLGVGVGLGSGVGLGGVGVGVGLGGVGVGVGLGGVGVGVGLGGVGVGLGDGVGAVGQVAMALNLPFIPSWCGQVNSPVIVCLPAAALIAALCHVPLYPENVNPEIVRTVLPSTAIVPEIGLLELRKPTNDAWALIVGTFPTREHDALPLSTWCASATAGAVSAAAAATITAVGNPFLIGFTFLTIASPPSTVQAALPRRIVLRVGLGVCHTFVQPAVATLVSGLPEGS